MKKFFQTILIFGLMLLLPIVLIGCGDDDDDDETRIKVCNTDDEKYDVELYRSDDNTLVKEFQLDKYYKSDACDKFSDVDDGRYYIKITEVDKSDNSDQTTSFYMESGDQKDFKIKSPGRISGDDSEGTDGTVEVCNTDDETYDVTLYRLSDDTEIGTFELEEYYSGDVCDEFSKVVTGEYYLFISEQGAENTNKSDSFYLDGGETETFLIESPGTIEKE
ncbi:hypothetical protein QUF72_18215 [Desulfobacterales bacterium HSG2]|nr:hypothetical protein [Desulfobacterales bacterium HSG2]